MHPAIYTQADDPAEVLRISLETGLTLDQTNETRQADRAGTDLNILLARHGATAPVRAPEYMDVDYDLDLATAYNSVEVAREMHRNLPENLRAKFPTWVSVLNGLSDGRLRIDNRPDKADRIVADPEPPKPPPTA